MGIVFKVEIKAILRIAHVCLVSKTRKYSFFFTYATDLIVRKKNREIVRQKRIAMINLPDSILFRYSNRKKTIVHAHHII